jgi:hypothetical protein
LEGRIIVTSAAAENGLTLQGVARRVTAVENETRQLALRAREIDRLEGRVLAEEGTSDALANQGWGFAQFAAYQRKVNELSAIEHADMRKEMKGLRGAVERATALPLALVAFFVCKEGNASSEVTIGTTAFIALVGFFAPQLMGKFLRSSPIASSPLGKLLLPEEQEKPAAPPVEPPAPPPPTTAQERDTFTNER